MKPNRVAVFLTVLVVAAFFGFLLLGAYASPFLAQPVWGAVPLSFVLGFGLIVGVAVINGLYAWAANQADAS